MKEQDIETNELVGKFTDEFCDLLKTYKGKLPANVVVDVLIQIGVGLAINSAPSHLEALAFVMESLSVSIMTFKKSKETK